MVEFNMTKFVVRGARVGRLELAQKRAMAEDSSHRAAVLSDEDAYLRVRPDGTYDYGNADPDGLLPTKKGSKKK